MGRCCCVRAQSPWPFISTMITPKDIHTAFVEMPLSAGDDKIPPYGKIAFTYQVTAYTDVRNLQEQKSYLVRCTIRIMLTNPAPVVLTPSNNDKLGPYPSVLSLNA